MRLLTLAATVALLAPLTACSSGDDEPVAAPSSATPSAEAQAGRLVLRGDGLAFVAGGETTMLPFGSGTSVVVPAIAASLGEPQPLAVECGQGVRDTVGVNGFDVIFDEDKMVGWDESGAGLSTDKGVKLGTTKQQLQQLLPDATFETTTLGPEFRSPSGLGGFLEGETPQSIVVGLTGGESCVAR